MLTVADRQGGMFDAAEVCGQVIPEDSFYALLAEHGHRLVCDEHFADCYAEGRGRPSIPPSLLAKVLLLAYREGASDERAVDCLRWKVALGLPVDHPGFHPTTLVKFRARLLLHGKERLALERTVELATELGLMEGQTDQIVDSTPMLGVAATQDTVRLVRSGVSKLIDAVRRKTGTPPAGSSRASSSTTSARARSPTATGAKARPRGHAHRGRARRRAGCARRRAGARAVRGPSGRGGACAAARADRPGLRRLRRRHPPPAPRHASGAHPVRPRPRYAPRRKSSSQRFDGYKLHATATDSEQPLITAVEVTPGCEQDGRQAGALLDHQPEKIRPVRVLGDTAYGDQGTRADLEQRSVEVLAPVHEGAKGQGLPKRDFPVDLEAGTVICPAGQVARIAERARADGAREAIFSTRACGPCPLKARCCPGRAKRQIRVAPREDLLQAGRRALADPKQAEHLRRRRPRIERPLGRLVHRYGARKSRYFGRRKSALQAAWTAALVNLHPLGAALRATPA